MLNNFSPLCSCISRRWEVYFQKRFWELIAPITASGFVKFEGVNEIFWDEVFMLRNIVKRATTLMIGQFLYKTKALSNANSPLSSYISFKNECEKIMELL